MNKKIVLDFARDFYYNKIMQSACETCAGRRKKPAAPHPAAECRTIPKKGETQTDMDNRFHLSPGAEEALKKRGFPLGDMVLFFRSDLDIAFRYAEVYCVATADTLAVLSGKTVVCPAKRRFPRGHAETVFVEYTYEEYELRTLTNISCTMNISSGLLSADLDGERTGIVRFSMAVKNRAFGFAASLEKLRETGEAPENDRKEEDELYCPKCGGRYVDPKRKFCPKCMDKSKLIRRLSVFFMKYRLYMVLSLLSLILTTGFAALLPYIRGSVLYDDVLREGGRMYGKMLYVVLLIVGTKFLSVVASTVNGVVTSKISAKVVCDIKKTVFSSISRLSYGFFTSRQTGGLMTSVNDDANSIYYFFCDGLPYLLINVVQFLAITGIMLSINPLLTLAAFVSVPLFIFLYRAILLLFDKMYAKNFSRRRSFNSLIVDVLSGIRVVKAFAREDDEEKRFEAKSAAFAESSRKIGVINSTVFPFINFALHLGSYMIWIFGGYLVMKSRMDLGVFMTFVGYLGMIYEPLGFFSEVSRWWAECINAVQRVFEILDAIPEVEESETPVSIGRARGDIVFSNVSFGYDKTRKTLDGIDFSVKAGETIGIVGETGAGKSTLVNLLIRLYDVSEGKITVDGVDVRALSFADLHRNIAIVSQETYLFEGTIMENIRYAKPDATDEEVFAAAMAADAHSFIIRYPDAYETMVGRGKKSLSGGECQRISIARAILKDPRILILDEATSAMDTATERRIQKALGTLRHGRTTIMIAHRLSTLRDADRIVVIDGGKMPEYGTHRELLEKRGVYHKLYRLQAEALKSIGIND